MTKKIRLSSIHQQGNIIDMEVILLNGEYDSIDKLPRTYYYTHQAFVAAGAICMKDELLNILTDRKHDRIELRKAHYIAGTASIYLTYAIKVIKG